MAALYFKERVRHLNQQFIKNLNDDDMMLEFIKEFTSVVDTSSVTRTQVLTWVRTVETQGSKLQCYSLKVTRDLEAIRSQKKNISKI